MEALNSCPLCSCQSTGLRGVRMAGHDRKVFLPYPMARPCMGTYADAYADLL
jgi:hypothetical protein